MSYYGGVRCKELQKGGFYMDMAVMQGIAGSKDIMIESDMNWYVREDRIDDRVHRVVDLKKEWGRRKSTWFCFSVWISE